MIDVANKHWHLRVVINITLVASVIPAGVLDREIIYVEASKETHRPAHSSTAQAPKAALPSETTTGTKTAQTAGPARLQLLLEAIA